MNIRLKRFLWRWVLTPKQQTIISNAEISGEGRILTPDQERLLDAPRETVLRAMLSPEAWRIVAAMENPAKWMPDPAFTKEESEGLEQFFKSPLGLKIDVAMINWVQHQAQVAIAAPTAEVLTQAKFALGCRAGWEMGKSISRLAAAQSSDTGDDAPTAADDLAQHQP